MLVFATETLAVGVNMPARSVPSNPNPGPNPHPTPTPTPKPNPNPTQARSVVFSQLDKPNDGDLPGHRSLRPDEFWQMAGTTIAIVSSTRSQYSE